MGGACRDFTILVVQISEFYIARADFFICRDNFSVMHRVFIDFAI